MRVVYLDIMGRIFDIQVWCNKLDKDCRDITELECKGKCQANCGNCTKSEEY